MTTTAYQYGLLDPLDWAEDCQEQLWLMNRFWNSLVEIERNHRASYREIVGADDLVAPLQAELDALRERQASMREERKRQRKVARARVDTSLIDRHLSEISAQIQPLAARLKEVRAEAKQRVDEPVAALNSQRFELAKAARQNSGLYWGNYNAVFASYETARSKAMKENGELRFRRFTGEGRFTVQIINGGSVDEITGGKKQVAIDLDPLPIPGRAGKPRPRLRITVYTRDREPRYLTFPLIYDRPLPEDARVQQVVVTRRKLGTKWRWAVVFTLRIERPEVTRAGGDSCGINLGFRRVPDGLRIAICVDERGAVDRLELPSDWLDAMDAVEAIQQQRDNRLNEIHAALKAHWPDRPGDAPEEFGQRLSNLIKAPKFSPASLAWCVLRWRDNHPEWWPDMLSRLESWRRLDKRDCEHQSNKRDHLIMARRERYRLAARWLCQRFAVIRIGEMQLRKMAQLETKAGEENELHARARANRQRASLYLLQQEIKLQAEKFGTVVEIVGGPVTITCSRCAGRCAVTADLMHVCESCSAVWDQDENAAANILAGPCERSSAS